MTPIFLIAFAYILGSVPFGLLIAKAFRGIDPRTDGSRNVGSTNVARLCGKKYGFLTLFFDIAKGAAPVAMAVHVLGSDSVQVTLTAMAAICGHLFSCFLGFKGGKAVATSIGVLLPLVPLQLLASAAVCILVIWKTEFVSAGSLTLVTLLPVLLAVSGRHDALPLACIITTAVWWSHRANIGRLLRGEEKSWLKKSESTRSE